jgi:flavodoxin
MKALVIYDSQYGNTKLLAEEMARVLDEYGEVSILHVTDAGPHIFNGEDLLVVGGPTQAHGLSPQMKSLLEAAATRTPLGGYPKALAFDTRLSWPKWMSGSAAEKIGHSLEGIGCTMAARPESFIVKGSEGPLAAGEKERAVAWIGAVLAQSGLATPAAAQ